MSAHGKIPAKDGNKLFSWEWIQYQLAEIIQPVA
jgi:hypothetical protein